MYYKITNKESEVYKKLHAQRLQERKLDEFNDKLIEDNIPYKFEKWVGRLGQQSFCRTKIYSGFVFNNPEEVCTRTWRIDKNYTDATVFIPNTRTKEGKAMREILSRQETSSYNIVERALGVEQLYGRITLPFMEISDDDAILLFIDDRHRPKDSNVIEITLTEFNSILKWNKEENHDR